MFRCVGSGLSLESISLMEVCMVVDVLVNCSWKWVGCCDRLRWRLVMWNVFVGLVMLSSSECGEMMNNMLMMLLWLCIFGYLVLNIYLIRVDDKMLDWYFYVWNWFKLVVI